LVFQSGNVIATGFKNLEQVDEITQEFYKICELVKKDIKRRLFIQ
jgi:TATA-box binding protein (TBP) (component of TFIID and TFIIIB)